MKISTRLSSKNYAFVCRALRPADAGAYKEIRLEALTVEDRCYFAADREAERRRSLADWEGLCRETERHALIGLFENGCLVGSMEIESWKKDPSGKTAYYRSAYVRPAYRQTDAAKILFRHLDDWAGQRGFERSAFAIRADNTAWLNRQTAHGATIIEKTMMTYTDGEEALTCVLSRPLPPTVLKATKTLEQIYADLCQENASPRTRLERTGPYPTQPVSELSL